MTEPPRRPDSSEPLIPAEEISAEDVELLPDDESADLPEESTHPRSEYPEMLVTEASDFDPDIIAAEFKDAVESDPNMVDDLIESIRSPAPSSIPTTLPAPPEDEETEDDPDEDDFYKQFE